MKSIVCILLLGLPLYAAAQNTYVKTLGTAQSDYGTACIPTADMGSLLTVCGGMPGTGGVQFGLVKADHNGTQQWAKLFAHEGFAFAQRVVPAAGGGWWVFGSVGHPTGGNNHALFLLRADATGNPLGSTRMVTSADDRPVAMQTCRAGGFVTCSVVNDNVGYPAALLMRHDGAGNRLWAKLYQSPYGLRPSALVELPDGDLAFVASGKFTLADPFPDACIIRTDAQGTVKWTSVFSLDYDTDPYAVAANAQGELYVAGATYRMGHEWDGFLLKVDAGGRRIHNRLYDAGTMQGEFFRSMALTAQGSVLLLGDLGTFEERDIALLDVNDQGAIRWAKRYPVSPSFVNYPLDMYTSYNGGIVFTGDVRPVTSFRDAALIRTDSLGNVPCHHAPAAYTVYDVPFTDSSVTVTATMHDIITDSITFTQPLQPVVEKPVCENPLPVVLNHWYASAVCPSVCMDFQDSTLNGPTAWLWTFEGATPASSTQQHPQNICYAEKGTYTVTLTATNATGTVTRQKKIVVHGADCPPPVVPNVFTPNGDGVNDEFLIDLLPDEFTLHIYNRWGEEVFAASEKGQYWKGKNKLGLPVTDGVYYYSLTAYDKDYHGYVHVFR